MKRLLPALFLCALGCDPKGGYPPTAGGLPITSACADEDADGICDAEDPCRGENATGDIDGDGICGDLDDDDDGDGCPDESDALPTQFAPDDDGDGAGNHCDPCPEDNPDDSDLDTVCDSRDICPGGDDGADADADGVPDWCDPCPDDFFDDSDGDGRCDAVDLCPGFDDGYDTDLDGIPQDCDPCPADNPNDTDGDGVCESADVCPGGDDTDDLDGDGVPDFCDPCPVDFPDDTDGDGVCDNADVCPGYVDGAPDADGDGFTVADGDCDDCDPALGPHMFDVPNSLVDEDCDGVVDQPRAVCDGAFALGDTDPLHAAAAMDMCDFVPNKPYGVVSASYMRSNGAAAGPGLTAGLQDTTFGNIVNRHGNRMFSLSSGRARELGHSLACGSFSCSERGPGTPPPGFPQNVPGCAGGTQVFDDSALEVDLIAPSNAIGFRMAFYFMSFEFPEWVCTDFNDQFVILMDPPPPGAINGNIAFDAATNPVSVNIAYQPVCDPASAVQWAINCTAGCPALPSPYCPNGVGDLIGTGFYEWDTYAGGTGWLEVTAPVTPGQAFTLRFAIWDTGDANLDSTVLIDDFEWVADPVTVGVQPQP